MEGEDPAKEADGEATGPEEKVGLARGAWGDSTARKPGTAAQFLSWKLTAFMCAPTCLSLTGWNFSIAGIVSFLF